MDQKSNAFTAAFAVRQIEIGLASFMAILFGVTAVFFGSAIVWSKHLPTWLSWIGVVGGLGTTVGGLLFAYSGFSTTAMNFGMAFNMVSILWMIAVGVVLWRKTNEASLHVSVSGHLQTIRFPASFSKSDCLSKIVPGS